MFVTEHRGFVMYPAFYTGNVLTSYPSSTVSCKDIAIVFHPTLLFYYIASPHRTMNWGSTDTSCSNIEEYPLFVRPGTTHSTWTLTTINVSLIVWHETIYTLPYNSVRPIHPLSSILTIPIPVWGWNRLFCSLYISDQKFNFSISGNGNGFPTSRWLVLSTQAPNWIVQWGRLQSQCAPPPGCFPQSISLLKPSRPGQETLPHLPKPHFASTSQAPATLPSLK